jgi:hypothetical protein
MWQAESRRAPQAEAICWGALLLRAHPPCGPCSHQDPPYSGHSYSGHSYTLTLQVPRHARPHHAASPPSTHLVDDVGDRAGGLQGAAHVCRHAHYGQHAHMQARVPPPPPPPHTPHAQCAPHGPVNRSPRATQPLQPPNAGGPVAPNLAPWHRPASTPCPRPRPTPRSPPLPPTHTPLLPHTPLLILPSTPLAARQAHKRQARSRTQDPPPTPSPTSKRPPGRGPRRAAPAGCGGQVAPVHFQPILYA